MSLRLLPPGYEMRGPDRASRRCSPLALDEGDARPAGTAEGDGDPLLRLMACPSFVGRLSPEDEVSYWCASELRRLTRARELRCVWSMVPGEQRQGGRLGPMHQAHVQALGYVPGCSDFVFLGRSGSGAIEIKVEDAQGTLLPCKRPSVPGSGDARVLAARKGRRTYQSERQRWFQWWCEELGIKHAVARRWGEMRSTLEDWDFLG